MSNKKTEALRLDGDVEGSIEFAVKQLREDGQDSFFLENELKTVLKEEQIKYCLNDAQQLVPFRFINDPGAKYGTIVCYDEVGLAKCVDACADDVPMVNLRAQEKQMKNCILGVGYRYCREDLRRAAKARRPLDTRLRSAALRAMNRKLDELALLGENGQNGLFNHSDVPLSSLPVNTPASTWTWEDAVINLNFIMRVGYKATKRNYRANTLGLSCDLMQIFSQLVSPHTGRPICAEFGELIKGLDSANVFEHEHLDTAGAAGESRIIAYFRDPEALEFNVYMRPSLLPAQFENYSIKFLMESKVSPEVCFYQPLSAVYADITI